MVCDIEIRNGRLVTPDAVYSGGRLTITDGRIHRIDPDAGSRARRARDRIDAEGRIVMPGIVDLHGDDIEQHLYPRPEARIDTETALRSSDRTNLTSGITTKFHAIAFEDTPEQDRSIATATEIAESIAAADDLLVDNRIHARCELGESSVAAVESVLGRLEVDLVSIMHHSPGEGQFADEVVFRKRYGETDPNSPEKKDGFHGNRQNVEGMDEFLRRRESVDERTLHRRAEWIVGRALDAGAVVASHDDERPESVEWVADLGVEICEYPVTRRAAERAKELGVTTAMGAPNLVRGGSLWGNLGAETLIEHDALDVLCSDYHPPSLLAAPFVTSGEPLYERVRRVTAAPADAVGLEDRGRLRVGARADVVVVDPEPVPTVDCVIVDGVRRFHSGSGTGSAESAVTGDLLSSNDTFAS
ncbi:MAG: alpha-D-ribose 1-methylphosphonate 5-triphosphate diphosphatase [Haloferacaceae archaeon]